MMRMRCKRLLVIVFLSVSSTLAQDRAKPQNYYDVLGVSPNSSPEEIKRAYRKKVFQYHPDRVKTDGDMIRQINQAGSVLTDPDQRNAYDLKNKIKPYSSTEAPPSSSRPNPPPQSTHSTQPPRTPPPETISEIVYQSRSRLEKSGIDWKPISKWMNEIKTPHEVDALIELHRSGIRIQPSLLSNPTGSRLFSGWGPKSVDALKILMKGGLGEAVQGEAELKAVIQTLGNVQTDHQLKLLDELTEQVPLRRVSIESGGTFATSQPEFYELFKEVLAPKNGHEKLNSIKSIDELRSQSLKYTEKRLIKAAYPEKTRTNAEFNRQRLKVYEKSAGKDCIYDAFNRFMLDETL